jgi:C_GCAxxG_C_C family probable redox protein
MSHVEAAVELFRSGCACSQAILGAYSPQYGLDAEVALRVAAGFGSGMRLAETCGAVTGAFMVLGLAYSGDGSKTIEGRMAAYEAILAFARDFKERQGSLVCRELLGCDVSTAEGAKIAEERKLYQTKCARLVQDAAERLEAALPPR